MPNRVPPAATPSRITTGCRFIAFDCRIGWRMLLSSCCTAMITTNTMIAVVRPLATRAMSTASAPAVNAPTMGMNPARKVMTASAHASGTPRRTSARPMKKASTNETIAWARM